MTAVVIALALVTALLTVLVLGLLRSHADILRALHELGVGEEQLRTGATPSRRPIAPDREVVPGVAGLDAPTAMGELHDIEGPLPDGGVARIGLDGSPGKTLLAFLSSGCSTCMDFWRALGSEDVRGSSGVADRIVIVTQGPEVESESTVRSLAPTGVTTVMSSNAWDDYGVEGSPYFVLVDGRRGVIGEGSATSWERVTSLLEKAVADAGLARGPREGMTRRDLIMGRDRELRADRELEAAGIEPGSPSLYGRGSDREQAER